MASEKQFLANRRNATKSTGPKRIMENCSRAATPCRHTLSAWHSPYPISGIKFDSKVDSLMDLVRQELMGHANRNRKPSRVPPIAVAHMLRVGVDLRWKRRQQRITRSDLATNDIDVAVAHPNMGGQTSLIVRRCTIIEY